MARKKIEKEKEIKNFPLRMPVKMSADLAMMSDLKGHSQNEIICKAIGDYFFKNRNHFIVILIKEMVIDPLEHDIIKMKENSNMRFGQMTIDFEMTDDEDVYDACLSIKNKYNKIVFKDTRQVNIQEGDWEDYKSFILEKTPSYFDMEDEGLKRYFMEKFSYE